MRRGDGAGAVPWAASVRRVRPAYRGGLRWDDGNTRYIFVRDGAGVDELRVDTGSGHYVLERVEGREGAAIP